MTLGYFDYYYNGGPLYIKVDVYVEPSNESVIIYGGDGCNHHFTATGTYTPGPGRSLGSVQNFNGSDGCGGTFQFSGPLTGY